MVEVDEGDNVRVYGTSDLAPSSQNGHVFVSSYDGTLKQKVTVGIQAVARCRAEVCRMALLWKGVAVVTQQTTLNYSKLVH